MCALKKSNVSAEETKEQQLTRIKNELEVEMHKAKYGLTKEQIENIKADLYSKETSRKFLVNDAGVNLPEIAKYGYGDNSVYGRFVDTKFRIEETEIDLDFQKKRINDLYDRSKNNFSGAP